MIKAMLAKGAGLTMVPTLALALTLTLAACGGEAEAPVDANPDAPPGIAVADGRMNLPAVAGNPGAVYFTIGNDSERAMMIRAASVLGAESAMMHQMSNRDGQMAMDEMLQVSVPAGGELVFEPGSYHVMAMGLDEGLEAGGETEVTLTFVGGDKVSFPVHLLAPGEEWED